MMTPLHKAIALAIGTALAGGIVGNNVMTGPLRARLAQAEKERVLERRKTEALTRVAELEQAVARYRPQLLAAREASAVIEAVNRMAEESSITLTSVTPVRPETTGGYVRVPVQVEVRCSYHQLGRFLSRVESASRFLNVDAVRVKGPSIDVPPGDTEGLMAVVAVSGFYRVQ